MILWEVARASAFIAFGCYTLVVSWGVVLAGRGWKPAAPQLAFHRFLSSLGLMAVVIHVTAVLLDHYARVPLTGLVGVGSRPAVDLGAAALWLTIALPLSFRLKRAKLMSQRAWRGLHYFGYALWGLALLHGIAAGTDSRSYPAIATYAVAGSIVAAAAWWRWMDKPSPVREPA
jgi:sulfoxide reductase heme-binding subunit YedZ